MDRASAPAQTRRADKSPGLEERCPPSPKPRTHSLPSSPSRSLAQRSSSEPASSAARAPRPASRRRLPKPQLTGPWRYIADAPQPIAAGRTSVWTGREMIVAGTNPGSDGTFVHSTELARGLQPGVEHMARARHAARHAGLLPARRGLDGHRDARLGLQPARVRSGEERVAPVAGPADPAWNRSLDGPRADRLGRRLLRRRLGRRLGLQPGDERVEEAGQGSDRRPAVSGRRVDRPRARHPQRERAGREAGRRSGVRPGVGYVAADRVGLPRPTTRPRRSRTGTARSTRLPPGPRRLRSSSSTSSGTRGRTSERWRRSPGSAVLARNQLVMLGGEESRATGNAYFFGTGASVPFVVPRLARGVDPALIWTGRELLVWGGLIPTRAKASNPKYLASGLAFRPGKRLPAAAAVLRRLDPPLEPKVRAVFGRRGPFCASCARGNGGERIRTSEG